MKKLLLPICAMLLCMTACKKEENEGILNLEIEHYNSNSKLHLDNDFAVWDNNDAVSINGTSYQIAVDNDNSKATIIGVPEAATYSAVYPAEWASGTFSIVYPQEQIYEANKVKAPMAAYTDGNNLKFKNLGSVLAVVVTNSSTDEAMNVQSIEVTAPDGVPLCGTYSINPTDYSLGTPTSTDYSIYLICDGVSIAAGNSQTFYIALPPLPEGTKLEITIRDDVYYYTRNQGNTAQVSYARNQLNIVPFATDGATTLQHAPRPNQIWFKLGDEYMFMIDDYYYLSEICGPGAETHYDENTHWLVATYDENRGPFNWEDGAIKETRSNIFNYDYESWISCVSLPSSVTKIGTGTFERLERMDAISMPGVTEIEEDAFIQCSVREVWMPKVTNVEYEAFPDCGSMFIYCKNPNPTIAERAFRDYSDLFITLPQEYEGSTSSWGSLDNISTWITWFTGSDFEDTYKNFFQNY